MTEKLLAALHGLPPDVIVAVLSALPVSELRGGIPAGVALGLSLQRAWLVAVLANIISVIPVLLGFEWFSELCIHRPLLGSIVGWLIRRARSKEEAVRRHGAWALTLFVGIPLPMTGAWTGALIASVFGMPFWRALGCIILGVLMASAIVSSLTVAGVLVVHAAR
ncbi:MAG: small multi-drug export protein [Armatimonadetes bacterium]|nr:small multi-drug export protein [Armatimonadota bacterium]